MVAMVTDYFSSQLFQFLFQAVILMTACYLATLIMVEDKDICTFNLNSHVDLLIIVHHYSILKSVSVILFSLLPPVVVLIFLVPVTFPSYVMVMHIREQTDKVIR